MSNAIPCPVQPGQRLRIPAGVSVWTTAPGPATQPQRTARAQSVQVHHTLPGWVEHDRDPSRRQVVLPRVVWAGSGGYWREVALTEKVCSTNALTVDVPDAPGAGAVS